jgi:hypothetical protein
MIFVIDLLVRLAIGNTPTLGMVISYGVSTV